MATLVTAVVVVILPPSYHPLQKNRKLYNNERVGYRLVDEGDIVTIKEDTTVDKLLKLRAIHHVMVSRSRKFLEHQA